MATDRSIKLVAAAMLCVVAAMPAKADQDPPSAPDDGQAAVEGPVDSKTPSAPKQAGNPVNVRGDLIFIMLAGHSSVNTLSAIESIVMSGTAVEAIAPILRAQKALNFHYGLEVGAAALGKGQ